MQCDFCFAAEPCWQYPAEDFRLPDGQISRSGWAACSTCHELIDAEKFSELARRAAGRIKRHTGVYALAQLDATHSAFRMHRSGAAVPLDVVAYAAGLPSNEIEQRESQGRISAAAAPTGRIEFRLSETNPRPSCWRLEES